MVEFRNVGRSKLTWTAAVPRPLTHHGLLRAIRDRHALLSHDVEFHDNGIIYVGGIRPVGTWKILDDAGPTPEGTE